MTSQKNNASSLNGKAIADLIIKQYKPNTAEDVNNALKDIFGPIFEAMLQGEMDNHLGYSSNERCEKPTDNRRNGYSKKELQSSYGNIGIKVPRDRNSTFSPQIVPKHSKDIAGIEGKVLAMYARGMSQRDIASTIEDIYGFEMSAEHISNITDRVLGEVSEWQNRPLKKLYAFMFVDCMYIPIRKDGICKDCAVYVILAYDANGTKDVLGLWIKESEGKHSWMQIFDELKSRGVEDILFLSIDGVSGLEEGAKSIFPNLVVQRCIVHLIRNSIKYVPSKEYKRFTSHLKSVYGATNLKIAEAEFERFKTEWAAYPGAISVWTRNWAHVAQLFNYGSSIRKLMYTTNAIESVNSSFRKVTKKGAFESEEAVLKLLFLRLKELYKKWSGKTVANWAMVRNQIIIDDNLRNRFLKYEKF